MGRNVEMPALTIWYSWHVLLAVCIACTIHVVLYEQYVLMQIRNLGNPNLSFSPEQAGSWGENRDLYSLRVLHSMVLV